jgi:hypothetical protein
MGHPEITGIRRFVVKSKMRSRFCTAKPSANKEIAEEIKRHNVGIARRIVEYWQRQGVEISFASDPTKDLRAILGPGGLPRGYRGQDAIPANRGRA